MLIRQTAIAIETFSASRVVICLLVILVLVSACAQGPSQTNTRIPQGSGLLTIEIKGLHNDNGQILVYLYPGENGFPDQQVEGLRTFALPIHKGKADLRIEQLPYNAYAISVLHDENGNGKMEKNLLGKPLEGFGFSLNPQGRFGPPEYSETRFLFIYPQMRQTIEVHYNTYRKERRKNRQNARRLS